MAVQSIKRPVHDHQALTLSDREARRLNSRKAGAEIDRQPKRQTRVKTSGTDSTGGEKTGKDLGDGQYLMQSTEQACEGSLPPQHSETTPNARQRPSSMASPDTEPQAARDTPSTEESAEVSSAGVSLTIEEFLAMVGGRVRGRRTSMGMSRKRLAARSGVSERYLAQLEAGQGNMSIALLRKVAVAMETPLDLLIRDPADAYDSQRHPDDRSGFGGSATTLSNANRANAGQSGYQEDKTPYGYQRYR